MGWFDERFENLNGRVNCKCMACNRNMWLPECKVNKYKTCGGDCAKKHRETLKNERKRICETCSSEFFPRSSQINSGGGKFCSQKCNTKARAALNSKESQEKAKASWKKRHAIDPIIKKGPANKNWKGGDKAKNQRVIARRRSDPYVRFVANIRTMLAHSMRGYGKRSRSISIIGCTFDELKVHIEKQFTKGMRWELVGPEIEIDHIIPLSTANTEDEIIRLNHFTNLRPLWKLDNRKKRDKVLNLL